MERLAGATWSLSADTHRLRPVSNYGCILLSPLYRPSFPLFHLVLDSLAARCIRTEPCNRDAPRWSWVAQDTVYGNEPPGLS